MLGEHLGTIYHADGTEVRIKVNTAIGGKEYVAIWTRPDGTESLQELDYDGCSDFTLAYFGKLPNYCWCESWSARFRRDARDRDAMGY